MRRFILLVLLLLAPRMADAGSTLDLAGIAYEQRIGAALPLDTTLRGDDGKTRRLVEIIDGRPLILTLGYFHCASLCGVARANLLLALERARLVAGRDFSFAALSIDPLETAKDVSTIKAKELDGHPLIQPKNFLFLTGEPDAVTRIASAVGFKSRPGESGLAHPLGVVFVSPSGIVSSYLLGVSYAPEELRLALRRAAAGETGSAASPLLLLCYDFDAATGRYTFAIMKFLRIASAVTAVIGLAALARAALGERRGA